MKPDCEHKRPPLTSRKNGTSSGPQTMAQLMAAKAQMAEERRTKMPAPQSGQPGPSQPGPRQSQGQSTQRQRPPRHEQVATDRQPSRRACLHASHDPLHCPRCAGAEQARQAQVNASTQLQPEVRNDHAKLSPKQAGQQRTGLHLESNSPSSELPGSSSASRGLPARKQFWAAAKDGPLQCIDQALRATDLLLQGGGFRVLVLDLGSIGAEHASRIPLATWFRFRSLAESTQCTLVVLLQHDCAKSAAELVLRLRTAEGLCSGPKAFNALQPYAVNGRGDYLEQDHTAQGHTVAHPPASEQTSEPEDGVQALYGDTIFGGLQFTAEVLRRRFENASNEEQVNAEERLTSRPHLAFPHKPAVDVEGPITARPTATTGEQSNVVSMRKPPQSWAGAMRPEGHARSATWTAQMAWAVTDAMLGHTGSAGSAAPANDGQSDISVQAGRKPAMAVTKDPPATSRFRMGRRTSLPAMRNATEPCLPYVATAGIGLRNTSLAAPCEDTPAPDNGPSQPHTGPSQPRAVAPPLHATPHTRQSAPTVTAIAARPAVRILKRPAARAVADEAQGLLHGLEHVAVAMRSRELGGRTGAGL